MNTIEKYLNEGKKQNILIGDYVKESPDGPFGNKEIGRVIKEGGGYWNVKFPGNKQNYEYHSGELALVKKANFATLQYNMRDKIDKIDKFIYEKGKFKQAYNLLEKMKKEVEALSFELYSMP